MLFSVGPSNFGSAVATSMNLTNSTEGLTTEHGVYKTEPNDLMYFANQTGDGTMNQPENYLNLWESDDFNAVMDMPMGDGEYQ